MRIRSAEVGVQLRAAPAVPGADALQPDVRAAPPGHEVEDLEHDVLVAVGQVSPECLKPCDNLLTWRAGAKLLLGGAPKIVEAVLRDKAAWNSSVMVIARS